HPLQLFVLLLPPTPPQTVITLPVHTAVGKYRPVGAPLVVVVVQLSVLGSYLPPVLKRPPLPNAPQTIISLPAHTAFGNTRPMGALVVLVVVQLSLVGSYLAPL